MMPVWTNCIYLDEDLEFAKEFGKDVETGTFFMNRCDIDPALVRTGEKDTGVGCSLSVLAFGSIYKTTEFSHAQSSLEGRLHSHQ